MSTDANKIRKLWFRPDIGTRQNLFHAVTHSRLNNNIFRILRFDLFLFMVYIPARKRKFEEGVYETAKPVPTADVYQELKPRYTNWNAAGTE